MNTKNRFLSMAVCAALLSPAVLFSANFNQKVSGKGSAMIEADVETTQTVATENARKNLVLSAMNRLLGTQISESDEMFAEQIPAILEQFDNFAEITAKTPSRDGAMLTISLNANLDEVEFRSLLKDLGVGLNQKTREMGSIVIFFDETEKPYDRPKEMFNEYLEYKHDNTQSYKERYAASASESSSASASLRDKSSASYANKASASMSASAQGSYSDKYAAKAYDGYSGSSESVNASSQGSAKYSENAKASRSSSGGYKNNYQENANARSATSAKESASIDEKYSDKEHLVYKREYKEIKEAPVQSGYVKSQLQKILKQYGLEFIDGSGKLAEYNKANKTKYKSYGEIMESADSTKFKAFVQKTTRSNYMGVAFSQINYSLQTDETTGKYGCTTTQSNVNIFSLKDGKTLDSGAIEAVKQSDGSVEGCKSNARFDMATALGQTVGLGVQKSVRDATRSFASGPVSYKIVLRGSFDRPTRRGFEGIMEKKKDLFKSFKLISQEAGLIQYEVTYKGTQSVGDVLLDAATSGEFSELNAVFNSYDLKVESSNTVVLYPTR